MLDFAILGLLRERPHHGYELKKVLGDLGFWQVSFGSLYPALRRLERTELIESRKGSGRRKTYRITRSGRTAFSRMLAEEPKAEESERRFQLRLAFFRYLEPRLRIRVLERRRAALGARLERAQRLFRGARGQSRGGTDRYQLALMKRRVRTTEADIAWLDELIAAERQSPESRLPTADMEEIWQA